MGMSFMAVAHAAALRAGQVKGALASRLKPHCAIKLLIIFTKKIT
jgi:hypothetical protein